MRPLRAVARFLFERGTPQTMALCRIAVGLAVLFGRLAMLPDVEFFYGPGGLIDNEHLTATQNHHAWSVLHRVDSWAGTLALYGLCLLSATTFTLGCFTRSSALTLFVMLVSLRWRNPLVINSADQLLPIVCFWMIFADAGRRWSIDAWRRARKGIRLGPWNGTWVLRTLQLQMCFLYTGSALFKLGDPDWVSGETMFYVAALVFDWQIDGLWMMDHPAIYRSITWGTLAFELGFPLLCWNRWTRVWLVAMAVAFHLGILVTMGIYFFSAASLALLTTFVRVGSPESRAPVPSTDRGSS